MGMELIHSTSAMYPFSTNEFIDQTLAFKSLLTFMFRGSGIAIETRLIDIFRL
jgi:hypothetical protein